MQLGKLLDTARHKPAVVHPVTFRVAALNTAGQKTHVDAEALLVHVDEEERFAAISEAEADLETTYKDKPIPGRMREEWSTYHFLAVALRSKADPSTPFAESGAAQLRLAMIYSVAAKLMDDYRAFIEREYHPAPPAADLAKMREEAAGK